MASWSKQEHAKGYGDQRSAEESHRTAGQVEYVAERKRVEIRVGAEEIVERSARCGPGRSQGEVAAQGKEERAERDKKPKGGGEGLAQWVAGNVSLFTAAACTGIGGGQQTASQQRECRQGGEVVVLLARGKRKESQDETRPEEKSACGFTFPVGRGEMARRP